MSDIPTPLEEKLNMLVQNPGQFTTEDRARLEKTHEVSIRIEAWIDNYEKSHDDKHKEIDRRLNNHSGEIRDLNKDRWKGSAAVYASLITFLSGIIGLIIWKWK